MAVTPQALLCHGESGAATACPHVEHQITAGEAERGDRRPRELHRERLEHGLVHAHVTVPSLRLLVRLEVHR